MYIMTLTIFILISKMTNVCKRYFIFNYTLLYFLNLLA